MKNGAFAYATQVFADYFRNSENDALAACGTVIAFSGGADSVLLLVLASLYAKKHGYPIAALHVHHGIRGEEADRDAAFCADVCRKYGVHFEIRRVSVPDFASEGKMGIEEAARFLRYRELEDYQKKMGYGAVLTAHHAGDNLETVLFHMMRGSGLNGLCGIQPKRGCILRPLLRLTKDGITAALREIGEIYVSDSTNKDTVYARNYIREEIVPRLKRLSPEPDRAVWRLCESLREDADYLSMTAEEFCRLHIKNGVLPRSEFSSLHPAIASRVFLMAERAGIDGDFPVPEKNHVESAITLASSGNTDFSICLPGGILCVGDRNDIRFTRAGAAPCPTVIRLTDGETLTPDGKMLYFINGVHTEFTNRDGIVYRLLKQIFLTHDTIIGGVFLRMRNPGDAYIYGGMRHTLHKMLGGAKLSKTEKDGLWLLCDKKGIIWVPGFSVRDGERTGTEYVSVYIRCDGDVDSE